ncbi:MAG: TIGR04283 family arsenosugar biosynthesis glycosyltransferase [Gammaproteobacteria bacterium]|nr:TIGR04283 family arsenosugar biosynthesis glycosyltransferase [Gammaproteobacteria bacterium]
MGLASTKISIIIPALNEATALSQHLPLLQIYRQRGHEIILVDGGSHDKSLAVARPLVDRFIQTVKGRAHQMNEGADVAKNDILLFLHADTGLPNLADNLILQSLDSEKHVWGRFNVSFNNEKLIFKFIGSAMNLRSTLSGVATGDQAIFVEKRIFEDVGFFDRIPLMEDVALSKKLLKLGKPCCLKETVRTSSRRWEKNGVWKTIFLMWRLRLAYFFGASPEKLADQYYPDSK